MAASCQQRRFEAPCQGPQWDAAVPSRLEWSFSALMGPIPSTESNTPKRTADEVPTAEGCAEGRLLILHGGLADIRAAAQQNAPFRRPAVAVSNVCVAVAASHSQLHSRPGNPGTLPSQLQARQSS